MTASQSNPEAETILSNSTHSWDEDLVLVGNDLFSPFFFQTVLLKMFFSLA